MHKRILVVDDDMDVCNALAMVIREEGYLVDNTSDSGDGAFFIKKNRYDVCLFDYNMKCLSGMDLLKMIKSKNPKCDVFIMSGILDIDTLCADENVRDLATGILSKPFDIEALFRKIGPKKSKNDTSDEDQN